MEIIFEKPHVQNFIRTKQGMFALCDLTEKEIGDFSLIWLKSLKERRLEQIENKEKEKIKNITFAYSDYKDIDPARKTIIYCDPPYQGTTKYKNSFDHNAFWDWCNKMVNDGHKVFVSEYQAPEGWRCIWERVVNSSLTKETGSKKATERLFTK